MRSRAASSIFPTTRMSLIASLPESGEAWRVFHGIYGPLVFRIALRAGLDAERAEEVVAAVMRRFFIGVRGGFTIDPQKGRLRSYLRTIVRHEIGAVRGKSGSAALLAGAAVEDLADSSPSVERQWADIERQERLCELLQRLRESRAVRPRDFAAFEQYAIQGEPPVAVARRFGITVNRLYGIKHALLEQLRKLRAELDWELGEV